MKKEDMLRVFNDLNDDFIDEAVPRSLKPKESPFAWLNTRVLAGAMAVLVLAILSPLFLRRPSAPVQIAKPFTSYAEKSAAEEKSGLVITCPEEWHDCSVSEYRVYTTGILEAVYTNADEETVLTIRKARGNEDISGDYSTYAEESTVTIDNIVITAKGSDGRYNLITWTADGFSYAVSSSTGILPEEVSDFIE